MAALGGMLLVKMLLVDPLRRLDRDNAALRQQLNQYGVERRGYFSNEDSLKALTARTFSEDVDLASAKSGALITREILRCGLAEASFTRLPLGPRKLRGAQELGWNIQGNGPLERIVDLLYVLDESPYLHRLDNLTFTPAEGEDQIKVRFNFLTLVITAAPDVLIKPQEELPDLESTDRHRYGPIVQRNLLKPFIPPPPPPPVPPPTPSQTVTPPTTPPPPGPESFRVVSLSQWQSEPEIHVRDLTRKETIRYQRGDHLAGGEVVMVDYRPLPKPGSEGLHSFSRVILRIGAEYWAIESGHTFAQKYRLEPAQLPPALRGG